MARRKRHGKSNPQNQRPAETSREGESPDRRRRWLAGAACALFVVQPLVAGDSAAPRGDGLTVVMLWIALAVVWLLTSIGRGRVEFRFGRADAAMLALVAWHTLSAIWAAKVGSPRPAVNMLWIWVSFGASFFLARQLFTGRREIRAMTAVMVALAVALSGYAVYQRTVELPDTWEAYEKDKAGALRAAGVAGGVDSTAALLFEKRLYSYEPLGTFVLTNSLAGYLAPWLVVVVGVGVGGKISGSRRWLHWLTVALCAAAMAGCLFWTKSRSAYLATLVGLPAAWWVCRTRKSRLGWKSAAGAAAALGVLVVILLTIRGLDERILSQASLSLGYRMQYWQSSADMIADHALLGCGPGQFQSTYTAYKLPTASEEIADPHNFLLEVWTTAGTPAGVALLALIALFAWAVLRSREGDHEPPDASGDADPPVDAVPHLLGGAVLGFLASIPLGLTGSVPTEAATVLIGLPLAAGAVAGLAAWIFQGQLPARLALVGVMVLLINLSAAGGIGFPGVAGTLWLLMALSLGRVDGGPARTASRKTAIALLALALLLAVGCYLSAFRPVLACRSRMAMAYEEPRALKTHLLAAAEADRWAIEPWNMLAADAAYRCLSGDEPRYRTFEQYQAEALRRAPKSASIRMAAAERYFQAYRLGGFGDALDKSVRMYRDAVDFYPNHATYRGSLALALWEAGDAAEAVRERDRALELDRITPHADKKLSAELRNALQRIEFRGQ